MQKKIKQQYAAITFGFFIQIIVLFLGLKLGGLLGLVLAQTAIKILWALMNIMVYEWSARQISVAQ